MWLKIDLITAIYYTTIINEVENYFASLIGVIGWNICFKKMFLIMSSEMILVIVKDQILI